MKLTSWRDRRLFITRTNNEGDDELLSTKTLWLRARSNDQIAWSKLWQECKQNTIPSVLKKYRHPRNDRAEMISACQLGFFEAISTWNPQLSPLSAFCRLCIVNKLALTIKYEFRLKRKADCNAISLDTPLGADKQHNSLYNLITNPADRFNMLYEKQHVEEIIDHLSPLLSPLQQKVFAHIMRNPDRFQKRYDRIGITQKSADNATQKIRTVKRDRLLQAYRAYQIL
jgi:hypothetical protein